MKPLTKTDIKREINFELNRYIPNMVEEQNYYLSIFKYTDMDMLINYLINILCLTGDECINTILNPFYTKYRMHTTPIIVAEQNSQSKNIPKGLMRMKKYIK